MLVGQSDAGVYQRSRGQDGTGLFGSRFEGELGEEGGSGVVGEADEVDFRRGFVDCADDELADSGDVLFVRKSLSLANRRRNQANEATTHSAIGRLYPDRILLPVRHQLARQRWEKLARRHMAQSRAQTDGFLCM